MHILHSPDADAYFDGRFFKVSHHRMTWYDARDTCNENGGYLATVCNEQTNNMLKGIMEEQGNAQSKKLQRYFRKIRVS